MKPNRFCIPCSSLAYTNAVSSTNGCLGQRKLFKKKTKIEFEIVSGQPYTFSGSTVLFVELIRLYFDWSVMKNGSLFLNASMRHLFRLDTFYVYIKLIMYQIP